MLRHIQFLLDFVHMLLKGEKMSCNESVPLEILWDAGCTS